MANIIVKEDFTGEYELPINCFSQIDTYIDKYEQVYLCDMLGADLYSLFIADLVGGVPVDPLYLAIFNPFKIDESGCIRISEGIKATLVQFIYFHAVRDLGVKKSIGGTTKYQNEVSSESMYSGFNIVESYNEGVDNYSTIQWYICDNPTDYPEYNGQPKCYASGI